MSHLIEKLDKGERLSDADVQHEHKEAAKKKVHERSSEGRKELKGKIDTYRKTHTLTLKKLEGTNEVKTEVAKALEELDTHIDVVEKTTPAAPAAPVESAYNPENKSAEELAADAKKKGFLTSILENETLAGGMGAIVSFFGKAKGGILKLLGYKDASEHSEIADNLYMEYFAKTDIRKKVKATLPKTLKLAEGKGKQNDDDAVQKLYDEWKSSKSKKTLAEYAIDKAAAFIEHPKNAEELKKVDETKPAEINLYALVGTQVLKPKA